MGKIVLLLRLDLRHYFYKNSSISNYASLKDGSNKRCEVLQIFKPRKGRILLNADYFFYILLESFKYVLDVEWAH